MAGAAVKAIQDYLVQSRDTVQAAIDDPEFVTVVGGIVVAAPPANVGRAAAAHRLAGEMLSRLNYDRAPAAALALTTDTSVLTAIGNDYGYDRLFERQILGLGRPGDVFIAISTSGRSPNVLRAIDVAREQRIVTVGFTGRTGGEMGSLFDLFLAGAPVLA